MTARAFTVERLPRRSPPPNAAPLPDHVRNALGSIADDLRHLPSDCIADKAELLFWLRRMANRIDGVSAMTVAGPQRESPPRARHRHVDGVRPATAREVAEAVFGGAKPRAARTATRTITSRRGKTVKVEVRRRSIGQFELEV